MFLVGVVFQFYTDYSPDLFFIPILMGPGSLLMTFGTLYLYLDNGSFDKFSGRFTAISVFGMILGLAISSAPLFYSSYTFIIATRLMLVGPLIFAYGLTVIGTQFYMITGLSAKSLSIISIMLIAGGTLLFFFGKGYTGNIYVSLTALPLVSGAYLLFAHVFKKSYNYWKRLGYFNSQ